MSLLYEKLVLDLFTVFSIPGTGAASFDLQNHANKFSTAIDDYTKELLDPGNRKPASTNKNLIYIQIITLVPGTSNFAASANISALKYATGIFNYITNITLSINQLNELPKPFISPGILDKTKTSVINLNVLTSMQQDFKAIFNSDLPLSEFNSINEFINYKSRQIADLHRKYVTNLSNINVKLEGKDSNPVISGGADFILTGPFKEE